MLTNPFYYGVFRLKGELHPGSHPAMISKEIFDDVQKRLEEKSRRVDWTSLKRNNKGFLFTELGKCGTCAYSIINDYHKKKSGKEFRYYRCSKNRRHANSNGPT